MEQLSLFEQVEKREPMGKPKGYVNRENKGKHRSIHIDIKGDAAVKLDIYCHLNNLNLTQYVNDLVSKDMADKFSALEGK